MCRIDGAKVFSCLHARTHTFTLPQHVRDIMRTIWYQDNNLTSLYVIVSSLWFAFEVKTRLGEGVLNLEGAVHFLSLDLFVFVWNYNIFVT